MKKLALLPALLLTAHLAIADDTPTTVPLEEAQKGAKLLTESAGTIANAPLKVDGDLDKPNALKAGSVGFLAIPDKQLSAEAMAKPGKEVTPVGQLWMMVAAPAKNGSVVPNSKLRLITVRQKDKEAQLQMFFLGARTAEKEGLELVVYGKDKEPLLSLPLKKVDGKQEVPIELKGHKNNDETGTLVLGFLGKYQAEMTLMKQEE